MDGMVDRSMTMMMMMMMHTDHASIGICQRNSKMQMLKDAKVRLSHCII
jgi:hypothetical protein